MYHSNHPLVPNPHSTPLHMLQHVADWVEPFNRSQYSPPPLLKFFHIRIFFHTTISTPLLLPPRDLVAFIIITIRHVTGSSGPAPSAAGCSPSTATFITAKNKREN